MCSFLITGEHSFLYTHSLCAAYKDREFCFRLVSVGGACQSGEGLEWWWGCGLSSDQAMCSLLITGEHSFLHTHSLCAAYKDREFCFRLVSVGGACQSGEGLEWWWGCGLSSDQAMCSLLITGEHSFLHTHSLGLCSIF